MTRIGLDPQIYQLNFVSAGKQEMMLDIDHSTKLQPYAGLFWQYYVANHFHMFLVPSALHIIKSESHLQKIRGCTRGGGYTKLRSAGQMLTLSISQKSNQTQRAGSTIRVLKAKQNSEETFLNDFSTCLPNGFSENIG